MRRPATSGGTVTTGVGPGRRVGGRGFGGLPRRLDRGVADDRLVDLEAAIDHVEQDGLARDEVERVGQEA